MSPRLDVVQRIEHEAELLVVLDVELGLFDVRVVRLDLHVLVEALHDLSYCCCCGIGISRN